MSGIKWQEGAVCFADGEQWFINSTDNDKRYQLQNFSGDRLYSFYGITNHAKEFQLNTIRQGDCIPKSELDAEDKYNLAIEVFGLFEWSFPSIAVSDYKDLDGGSVLLCDVDFELYQNARDTGNRKRKLTYPQIMAIGELKHLEIERGKSNNSELPNSCEDVVNNQEVKMQKNKPVVAQVMIDLTERMEIGIKTYGEALRANNGRDALQDAYEEALDLACYLKQAMIERDDKEDE